MPAFRTLDDANLKGKRVLCRVDLNVPVADGKVTDATPGTGTSLHVGMEQIAGMAGIKLAAGAEVVSFTAFAPDDTCVVVTVAGSGSALPGTEAGTIKVTPLAEYPGKGLSLIHISEPTRPD